MPPSRDGVGPSCVGLTAGPWPTIAAFLIERFPFVDKSEWLRRMVAGDVSDEHGAGVSPGRAYQAPLRVYYYRSLAHEPRIPFDEVVLWQDEHLLVVDKPHFLPVMPSGKYLQETVLVRLRRKLGLDALVPIHRIDRDTAGLVLFSVQSDTRDAYHTLFRKREVKKIYEAIAPWNPRLSWPQQRETRIVAAPHFMQQIEVEGPPNSLTHMAPVEVLDRLARYELHPVTGQRHQLRVHMAALGLPLVGDGIYPVLTPEGQMNHARPLQLLARSIAFVDPLTGQARRFESHRRLRSLPDLLAATSSQNQHV